MKETVTIGELIDNLSQFDRDVFVYLDGNGKIQGLAPDSIRPFDADHQRVQYIYLTGKDRAK